MSDYGEVKIFDRHNGKVTPTTLEVTFASVSTLWSSPKVAFFKCIVFNTEKLFIVLKSHDASC